MTLKAEMFKEAGYKNLIAGVFVLLVLHPRPL